MDLLRISDFDFSSRKTEKWILKVQDREYEFVLDVRFGKPIDIISLKKSIVSDLKESINRHIKHEKDFCEELGINDGSNRVKTCPVCGTDTQKSVEVLKTHGFRFNQCAHCTHVFVINRPHEEELLNYYSKNSVYQSHFADADAVKKRLELVVQPKLDYVIEQYERVYGRKPRRILDVGAGSGHFVYACKNSGIHGDGIEISELGRAFCREQFGIELYNCEFTNDYDRFKDYDIVTFWGVIEHVSYPYAMIEAAARVMSNKESMICIEVPKWNSFTVEVQKNTPDTIIRHLAPSVGHINVFTEKSLAYLFARNGINIVGAWYYGMDFYELLTQIQYTCDADMKDIQNWIAPIQQVIDSLSASDQLVFTGIPSK